MYGTYIKENYTYKEEILIHFVIYFAISCCYK